MRLRYTLISYLSVIDYTQSKRHFFGFRVFQSSLPFTIANNYSFNRKEFMSSKKEKTLCCRRTKVELFLKNIFRLTVSGRLNFIHCIYILVSVFEHVLSTHFQCERISVQPYTLYSCCSSLEFNINSRWSFSSCIFPKKRKYAF